MTITEKTIGGVSPDYATLTAWQAARKTASSSGDTERAIVRSGVYDERVNLTGWTDGVIIELVAETSHGGIEGKGPVINPSASGVIFIVNEAGCTLLLDGISLTGPTDDGDDGIYVQASGGVTARNCLFYDIDAGTSCDAIQVQHNGAVTVDVENCSFRNIGRGAVVAINVPGPVTVNMRNCTVVDSAYGVRLWTDSGDDSFTANLYNTLISASTSCVLKQGGGGTEVINLYDCIITDGTATTHADVAVHVTENATFQAGAGGSGDRVMFSDLVGPAYDLHLFVHQDNLARGYGNPANAPSIGTDWEGDTRHAYANVDAGADQSDFIPDSGGSERGSKIPRTGSVERSMGPTSFDGRTAPPAVSGPRVKVRDDRPARSPGPMRNPLKMPKF